MHRDKNERSEFYIFALFSLSQVIPREYYTGFPGSSAGKESACNAGDPGLIPGLGRSPGEGIGYPFQYSWACLVAQMIKNPSAMQETWVWSLGWEGHPEEGMAIHSSILAWRISMERGTWEATVHGVTKSWTWPSDKHSTDRYRSTFNVVLVQSISSKSVSKKILRKYVNFESNSSYRFTDKIKMIT